MIWDLFTHRSYLFLCFSLWITIGIIVSMWIHCIIHEIFQVFNLFMEYATWVLVSICYHIHMWNSQNPPPSRKYFLPQTLNWTHHLCPLHSLHNETNYFLSRNNALGPKIKSSSYQCFRKMPIMVYVFFLYCLDS